jgi:acylphosphatase
MPHYKIFITGKVQGVGFRFSAMQAAYRIGILGFAKNQGSDMVYIEAEGEQEQLDQYLNWCRKGPPGSKVENVRFDEGTLRHYTSFEIVARDFQGS